MQLPTTGQGRFVAGAGLPLRAVRYLADHPALARYAILPLCFNVAGIAAALVLSVPASGWLLGLAWARPEGWLAAAWWAVRAAVVVALAVAAALVLPAVISAPFADRLSARVEALELGEPAPGGLARAAAEAWRGVANAVARGVGLLLWLAILLPAALVPLLYPALAFLVTARWAAIQWLDLPMARNLHHVRDVKAALRAVRPLGLGYGAVLTLALAIPFADLLVVPVGAVSGTLLFCDLVRAGVVPRAPGHRAGAQGSAA